MKGADQALKETADEVFRLMTLGSELDRKLAAAHGELGFLKDEHTRLPSDPTITAQALADHRKKVEAKERATQGLVEDRANVEKAFTDAKDKERETRKLHFHRFTQPEKLNAAVRIGRSIAKRMQDLTSELQKEARRMAELNQEMSEEVRQIVGTIPDREGPSDRASHWVTASLTQTQQLWANVEKGLNQYAKGLGE